jgi:hypothetical protein
MASSISSSEETVRDVSREALPSGLRLTAADRPGVAQPVPERDIPDQPWRAMSLVVLVLVIVLTGLWEWKMRAVELIPGDNSDGTYDSWVQRRQQVDKRDVPVLIIGDSRILYDTDLDHVAQLTGVRPIQLAIVGSSGLPILEDIADDSPFKGLAIVGMAETAYFDTKYSVARPKEALELRRWESPSKRASYQIQRVISPGVAMLEEDYQLSTLIFHLDPDWRPGAKGPYHDVWKVGESSADGQAWIWRRLEHDQRLSTHARSVWLELFPPFPIDDKNIAGILARTKIAVDKIRARGGDVVFVRPPSGPDLRAIEDKHIPRARGWNALLAYTHTNGVHIDDLPTVQKLILPESSHLTHACATVFTDAYIRILAQQTPLLHLKPDLPPALTTRDCVPSSVASLD